MGIEQNKGGAWVPDKETKWPNLKEEERSKVYSSMKEKYAGSLASSKRERDDLEHEIWDDVILGKDPAYAKTPIYTANDPKISAAPVSSMLKLEYERIFENDYNFTPKQMMFFSLDYLQNAEENQALKNELGFSGNIDTVPADATLGFTYYKDRWALEIKGAPGSKGESEVLFLGYLSPRPWFWKEEEYLDWEPEE